MPTPPLSDELRREALDALALYGSVSKAALALGLSRSTLRSRLEMARAMPPTLPSRIDAYPNRLYSYVENGCVVVFNDAHYCPGEVSTAHRALIECIREFRPRGVVANGDVFDGASVGRHPRTGWEHRFSVKEEIEACDARLGEVEAAAGSYAWKVWTLGNHDIRYDTHLSANSAQYEGVRGMGFKEHFPAWMFAWRLDINPATDGHTIVKHRWKNGVHAPHNNTRDAGVSMVTGHLHAQHVARWTDARGTRYGVDPGTLAEVDTSGQFNYLEDGLTQWRSGFALLTFNKGRLLTPELISVVAPGVVEFRGREHRV